MRYEREKEKVSRPASKPSKATKTLESMLRGIPLSDLMRMAGKSGLPPMEQRALCMAFRELKS